jgi:hypothetical protein
LCRDINKYLEHLVRTQICWPDNVAFIAPEQLEQDNREVEYQAAEQEVSGKKADSVRLFTALVHENVNKRILPGYYTKAIHSTIRWLHQHSGYSLSQAGFRPCSVYKR